MAGGHAWQERRPLLRTVRILLECIPVFTSIMMTISLKSRSSHTNRLRNSRCEQTFNRIAAAILCIKRHGQELFNSSLWKLGSKYQQQNWMFVFQLQLQNMTPAKCSSMSPETMEMSVQMQSPVKLSKPSITHPTRAKYVQKHSVKFATNGHSVYSGKYLRVAGFPRTRTSN